MRPSILNIGRNSDRAALAQFRSLDIDIEYF
jgi:hypothetical protein